MNTAVVSVLSDAAQPFCSGDGRSSPIAGRRIRLMGERQKQEKKQSLARLTSHIQKARLAISTPLLIN